MCSLFTGSLDQCMYDLIYTIPYATAANMNPYCLVVIAYTIHRHSLNSNRNQAHMDFRPTKYMPVTPIAANTYDHIYLL